MYKWLFVSLLVFIPTIGGANENLFLQENKWEACYYFDIVTNKVVNENCSPSKIKISSCDENKCFFQMSMEYGKPVQSECIMWGKLYIDDDNMAHGNAIAEYRKRGMMERKFEDCELNFKIIDNTMKISIKSGCDKWCRPDEFEFNNVYHIDNTGGAVTL